MEKVMKNMRHIIKLVGFSLLALFGTSLFIVMLEVQRTATLS
jgi:hypothetical protein